MEVNMKVYKIDFTSVQKLDILFCQINSGFED